MIDKLHELINKKQLTNNSTYNISNYRLQNYFFDSFI